MAVAVLTEMNSESKKTSIAASLSTQGMNPLVLCGIGSTGTEGQGIFRDSRAPEFRRRRLLVLVAGVVVVVVVSSAGRDLRRCDWRLVLPTGPLARVLHCCWSCWRQVLHCTALHCTQNAVSQVV